MKVFFINNDGGGFATDVEVQPGTTISQFFKERMKDAAVGDFLIRVDRQVVASEHVLTEGCRVSITPTKVAGA